MSAYGEFRTPYPDMNDNRFVVSPPLLPRRPPPPMAPGREFRAQQAIRV